MKRFLKRNQKIKVVHQNSFSEKEKETLWQLWNNEYPIQFGHETFQEFESYCDALINTENYNQILNGWVIDHERDIKRNKEKYRSLLEILCSKWFLCFE
ncbi:hypothetical protein [Flavobacterium ajazii]|uniref:hypothetical protein n=1 Tax=Flavobacterium ajazii TaxID=2692318 RepID=UPI0013D08657|nr:hypothetical protein [Flavobacterium ajazii]